MKLGLLILLSSILVAIAFLLLAIKIFFSKYIIKRQENFPNTSIGGNKNMRKAGIICPKQADLIERKKVLDDLKAGTCGVCSGDAEC